MVTTIYSAALNEPDAYFISEAQGVTFHDYIAPTSLNSWHVDSYLKITEEYADKITEAYATAGNLIKDSNIALADSGKNSGTAPAVFSGTPSQGKPGPA